MRQCIMSENRFDFLRELVKNVPDINVAEEQQHNHSEASTSSVAAASASAVAAAIAVDSDDDIEIVSGNSTPTASSTAGTVACPPYITASTSYTSASTTTNVVITASNGQKCHAIGEPINYSMPASYANSYIGGGIPSAVLPPPPQPTLSAPIAANYYTEIDSSSTSGDSVSASQPSVPVDPPQNAVPLHRSVSTPATVAATPNSSHNISVQPPIINFDFSMGLPNAMSIRYTTPVTAGVASVVEPVVKIDLSNIAPTVIAPLAGSSSSSHSSEVAVIAKPRRGRPPKIRPTALPFGAVGQPLSAPPQSTVCSPFTPTTTGRQPTKTFAEESNSGGSKAPAPKYQKTLKTTSTLVQIHHRRRSASSAGNGVTMASMAASPALPLPMVAVPTTSSSSCLDMDEDYDNI